MATTKGERIAAWVILPLVGMMLVVTLVPAFAGVKKQYQIEAERAHQLYRSQVMRCEQLTFMEDYKRLAGEFTRGRMLPTLSDYTAGCEQHINEQNSYTHKVSGFWSGFKADLAYLLGVE